MRGHSLTSSITTAYRSTGRRSSHLVLPCSNGASDYNVTSHHVTLGKFPEDFSADTHFFEQSK
eukprot:1138106-Amorphochlora_amoeboformis.AAC.1